MIKLFKSFGYAFKGLRYAFTTQLNFRIHLGVTILALLLSWDLNISTHEWLWILLCITLVLSAELFNTAIETLTNMVSPKYHQKAGFVKDVAAGAVIITAIFALAVGGIILGPKLFAFFNR